MEPRVGAAVAEGLDGWLPTPVIRVQHRREANVDAVSLWRAAGAITLADTRALGALVRLRIPGLTPATRFDEMFRSAPFNPLCVADGVLVSGLVGRIWTLRRDYPSLPDAAAFREWRERGTVRVLFANWVEPLPQGRSALVSETRVDAVDRIARLGLTTLAPLITGSHSLIGSDGLAAAVRRAEAGRRAETAPR
ncbi:hypothetical protein [Conexibacter sp. DBS9H8]|uniref:hypothetical protein n=1 Tax=Conexibacter sp. DBS9H8 TaxID=2937801 RepID=UPI00200DFBA4|nr:hypothetical protein [Conexibacter sp. DBS9H8]